jgi:hypothetical protein
MTRRDYILLANTLRDARPGPPGYRSTSQQTWMYTVCRICDALKEDNPHFDRVLFLMNAGVRGSEAIYGDAPLA